MSNLYVRNCLCCKTSFTTSYWNKKFCGSEECEQVRQKIKNRTGYEKRIQDPNYKEETHKKYFRNRKKVLEKKRIEYRLERGFSKDAELFPTNSLKLDLENLPDPYFITQRERSSQRLSYSEVFEYFSSKGFQLLSKEYYNNVDKLDVICPNGHQVTTCFMSFRRGNGCSECASHLTRSSAEQELCDFIRSEIPGIIILKNFRLFENRQEVDIYLPEHKVAIEYCGLYWHNEDMLAGRISKKENPRKYHRNKMDACNARDIRLITVFEDEYLSHPDVVRSRILNALGHCRSKIYARNCVVREISERTANSFLMENHLQGSSYCSVAYGLYFQDELISVLTGGFLNRKNTEGKNRTIELKRFSSLPFYSILGGFSKLFKRFAEYARSEEFIVIKSFADMRYANPFDTVYSKAGFTLLRETKYSYFYVLGKRRYSNQSLCKTAEEKLSGKTEAELRKEQGYSRIWDCGSRTYVYHL